MNIRDLKLLCVISLSVVILICIVVIVTFDINTWKFSATGAALGCLSCVLIFINYYFNPHLSGTSFDLLFYRSIFDFGLALKFFFDPYVSYLICGKYECFYNENTGDYNYDLCSVPSAFFQLCEMGSEAWFFCLAFDMAVSVSNPLSSFKNRMKYYKIFTCVYSAFLAMVVGLNPRLYGFWESSEIFDETAFCWISHDNSTVIPWMLFYLPIMIVYTYSFYVIRITYLKIREGIASTFNHRIKALIINATNILVFFLYWSILLIIYISMFLIGPGQKSSNFLYKLVMFGLPAKGVVDLLVWIIIVDEKSLNFSFTAKNKDSKNQDLSVDLNAALRSEVLLSTTTGLRESAKQGPFVTENHSKLIVCLEKIPSPNPLVNDTVDFKRFISMVFNFGVDSDKRHSSNNGNNIEVVLNPSRPSEASPGVDVDVENILSPRMSFIHEPDQLQSALYPREHLFLERHEDDFYFKERIVRLQKIRFELFLHRFFGKEETPDHSRRASIYSDGDKKYQLKFEEFEPYYYRQIRLQYGISDELYIDEFLTTIKERLTEGGASGAFFFFSKNEAFIAKSCTSSEIDNLRNIAKRYSEYLRTEKDSYITKIYGVYNLHIYGTSLSFLVMNNLFLNSKNETINEKYDIKGSYIKRNAGLPVSGRSATCKECNQKFIYHRKDFNKKRYQSILTDQTTGPKCPMTVNGIHEPSIVMKDNDLKYKLKLPYHIGKSLQKQIAKDSNFLYSLGVMDYSLLIGVHTTEYDVDVNVNAEEERSLSIESLGSNSSASRKLKKVSSNVDNQSMVSDKRLQVSKVVGPEAYYIGIVDFQQQFDFKKRTERFFKTYIMGLDPNGLSCVEPEFYQQRFMQKVDELIMSDVNMDDSSDKASIFSNELG